VNKLLLYPFLRFVEALDDRLDTHSGLVASATRGTHEGLVVDVIGLIHQVASDLGRDRRLHASGTLDDLRYVMAAWSDELLMSPSLEAREGAEVSTSVEQRLFQTMEAGEKVFWCIDRVLSRRSEGDLQMAPVYLTLLAMGYRGQYGDSDMPQRLRVQLEDLCAACGVEKWVDAHDSMPLEPASLQASQSALNLSAVAWSLAGFVCLSCLVYADWHWQRSTAFIDAQFSSTSSQQAAFSGDSP
jgi:type IV/VI secretion system ImpK/VasF family protein